jgi:hypothetical protein
LGFFGRLGFLVGLAGFLAGVALLGAFFAAFFRGVLAFFLVAIFLLFSFYQL